MIVLLLQGLGVVCDRADLYYPSSLPLLLLGDSFVSHGFTEAEVKFRATHFPSNCC